ncbi:DUF433 domain-containing protein [Candidatus Gottesmanbacteria bacterium]|nr:DUF433 domain-containing protein [Candidatus Gottesmanbacteria bacterium]
MKYITSNPKIMSGVPVIQGTRIPISRVVFLLREGYTIEAINGVYPHLKEETLRGAIDELIHDIDTRRYEKTSAV